MTTLPETITLTEVSDVVTPEEETYPENYNFEMEVTYEETTYSQGGGESATLIDKDISTNGTYNASSDSADGYKKVVVDVANSYAAGDEGKVVSNGALVAQTSDTVTTNDTYDTTLINSLTVNVSGGGGSRLPNEYQEVEYVQFANNAYFNTGYVPKIGDAISTKFGLGASVSNSVPVFSAGNGNYQCIALAQNSKLYMRYFSTTAADINNTFTIGNLYDLRVDGTGAIQLNGKSVRNTPVAELDGTGDKNLFIGYRKGVSSPYFPNGRISYFKISNITDGTIRELISCYRKNDNVAGMFDIANNQFYTPVQGTLIVGDDVINSEEALSILMGESE